MLLADNDALSVIELVECIDRVQETSKYERLREYISKDVQNLEQRQQLCSMLMNRAQKIEEFCHNPHRQYWLVRVLSVAFIRLALEAIAQDVNRKTWQKRGAMIAFSFVLLAEMSIWIGGLRDQFFYTICDAQRNRINKLLEMLFES
jgi:hypothetical protein